MWKSPFRRPERGPTHDALLFENSGLRTYLEANCRNDDMTFDFHMYGDSGYALGHYPVLRPYRGRVSREEVQINRMMAKHRQCVEWFVNLE